MNGKRPFLMALAVSVALAAAFAVAGSAGAASCTPATNIEAIIDDSGSMYITDSAKNRVAGLDILIGKSGNASKTLGAVEFGGQLSPSDPPAADTVFAPAKIGANAAAMKAALKSKVNADNGTTDYNAAFALAKSDNPTANARIFLTDGGHNAGDYQNGHQGGPPTYVIGLGIGAAGGGDADADRLQQIANDTGGIYYPNVDTGNVAATMNEVDAALNCQAISQTFTDQFSQAGQSKAKTLKIASSTKSIDLVLTWANPLDQFDLGSIKLKTSSGTIASISRRHLKIKRTKGDTFLTVHVSGLKRGKLKFKLRAVKLGSGAGGVSLTTQATQSRRR